MKKQDSKSNKITFGKRKGGKHRKSRRPKEARQKQYRGQGK